MNRPDGQPAVASPFVRPRRQKPAAQMLKPAAQWLKPVTQRRENAAQGRHRRVRCSHARSIVGACATILTCGLLPACSATDPLVAWRTSVTHEIEQRGNGDPNVLRDLADERGHSTARPARITFAKLGVHGGGIPPFAGSRDVRGVLVGQTVVDDEVWFVFVVGVVDAGAPAHRALRDVHLAALTVGPDGLRWRTTGRHPAPLAAYAARSDPPEGSTRTFPTSRDVFDMRRNDATVTVTERRTGARWKLRLGPTQSGSGARTAAVLNEEG